MAMHRVESQVTGTVWKVERQLGDVVGQGDTILIIESMKMEIPVIVEQGGTVQRLLVDEAATVSEGQAVAVLSK